MAVLLTRRLLVLAKWQWGRGGRKGEAAASHVCVSSDLKRQSAPLPSGQQECSGIFLLLSTTLFSKFSVVISYFRLRGF